MVGRVSLDPGFGVVGPDFVQWQVVVDHAQAQIGEAGIEGTVFVFSGDQHRLVHGIRPGKHDAGRGSFKAVGTA
ncbi:hypothetical protein D3C80_1694800 [compost metagenome]